MSFYLQAKLYVNQIYFLCHDLIYPSLQKNVHYLKVGGGELIFILEVFIYQLMHKTVALKERYNSH